MHFSYIFLSGNQLFAFGNESANPKLRNNFLDIELSVLKSFPYFIAAEWKSEIVTYGLTEVFQLKSKDLEKAS